MGDYIMGRTAAEAERLEIQAAMYAPHTEHLLRLAGVGPGMRVLDIGCGLGDVTMLAAHIVGPTGHVIGADVNPDMVLAARQRAKESDVDNVTFVRAEIPDVPVDGLVDAVIGRLILMHLPDPAAAVRSLRSLVRPGGIVSFQEVDVIYATSPRAVPLAATCLRWCEAACRLGGGPLRGGRLGSILRDAGLNVAGMAVETPVTHDPESPDYRYYAGTVTSLLPLIIGHGVATGEEVGVDTLLDRLRAEARDTGAVAYPPELVGAWAIEGAGRV
ncbi:MAG TPA: class I SAM-dependent methyltransferase [Pseudonocardiaceae bacterium]|nr:class I SAM-dependent methyltransferase [Pseudonocardiaceae bacterium]